MTDLAGRMCHCGCFRPDLLTVLIAAWVADIESAPIPEFVDVDTAVAMIRGDTIRGADDER